MSLVATILVLKPGFCILEVHYPNRNNTQKFQTTQQLRNGTLPYSLFLVISLTVKPTKQIRIFTKKFLSWFHKHLFYSIRNMIFHLSCLSLSHTCVVLLYIRDLYLRYSMKCNFLTFNLNLLYFQLQFIFIIILFQQFQRYSILVR